MNRRGRIAALWLGCAALACEEPSSSSERQPPRATVREGGTERPAELVFAVTPFVSTSELRAEYAPVVEHVAARVGLPAQLRLVASYAEVPPLLTSYAAHVVVLTPFSYLQAKRDNPTLIPLVTPVADGATTYAGYIFAHADSGLTEIKQLGGKRFAFVDPLSASGYLYPLAYLRQQRIEASTFFSSVVFAGDHSRLLQLILAGEVDAGASYAPVLKRAEARQLRVIAKTGRIPMDVYCASPRLDQALIDALRTAFLELSTRTKEGRQVLSQTGINGFQAVTDADYDEVRRVAALAGID